MRLAIRILWATATGILGGLIGWGMYKLIGDIVISMTISSPICVVFGLVSWFLCDEVLDR